jgi:preprotein translocase subunit SecE
MWCSARRVHYSIKSDIIIIIIVVVVVVVVVVIIIIIIHYLALIHFL